MTLRGKLVTCSNTIPVHLINMTGIKVIVSIAQHVSAHHPDDLSEPPWLRRYRPSNGGITCRSMCVRERETCTSRISGLRVVWIVGGLFPENKEATENYRRFPGFREGNKIDSYLTYTTGYFSLYERIVELCEAMLIKASLLGSCTWIKYPPD